MASSVTTRFFIISDAHGDALNHVPVEQADVAIHCGDLTEESKLDEFRKALNLLKEINASLKLVIAGNHDFTVDVPVFKEKIDSLKKSLGDEANDANDDLIKRQYGAFGEARELFNSEDARAAGIVFLDEGTHRFDLANGAVLTVYASSNTCGAGGWGFQYRPDEEHTWSIHSSVDVAITHSPPKGVLDYTDDRKRAGSSSLFEAIARAKPKVHGFGHIHEAWGAKKVTWRSELSDNPSHFTDIDNDESYVIKSVAGLRAHKFDTSDVLEEKAAKRDSYRTKGYCSADVALRPGEQTLFINAAIEGPEEGQQQLPWMVDIDLPRRTATDIVAPASQVRTSQKRKVDFEDSDVSNKRHCGPETSAERERKNRRGFVNEFAAEKTEAPVTPGEVLCR